MNLNTERPIGDATTLIDLVDRDEMDDDLFPLDAEKSWFTRDPSRRYLNFSPVIQEFVYKGSAEFGNKLVFEIGSVKACDLLFSVALQIRLGHWFPPNVVEQIQNGTYTYRYNNSPDPDNRNPNQMPPWFYANSLGSILIKKADFLLEDQVLESVDGDFSNMFGLLFSDINTQFGAGVDAQARVPIPVLLDWNPNRVFPTTNGFISCILPFSFQRIRLKNGFPLSSVKEGTIRIALTLRPFDECVRILTGIRSTCNETPLGQTFTFQINNGTLPAPTTTIVASSVVPAFEDCRLVTYGMLVDGKLRTALLKSPFERMYREVQTFRFSEPKKYIVNVPSSGVVSLQLPVEVNGPIEEFIWFIRRKAVSVNNEWTNYSNTLESEFDGSVTSPAVFHPFQSMLVSATLQVNGITLVQRPGEFFRRDISQNHRGGIVAYNSFVYGYTFAKFPGRQNPTGWMNSSRSTDVRWRMDIKPPGGSEDLEFEVVVFALSMNWVRFENSIANKVFSS
jgi:hypothetical protein